MDANAQWSKLAVELGFQLKREIRPFVELPSLHKMAERAMKKGDLKNAERLLKNPMITKLMSSNFIGSATGLYGGYEFAVFRSTHSGTPSPNPAYYINIVLLFKEKCRLGLEIQKNDIFSKIKKAIGLGSYVKIAENHMLNEKVSIKANLKDQARKLLSNKLLQDKLLNLYLFSNTFEISDRDIRYSERGEIIDKDKAIKIMDMMVEAAKNFPVKG